MGSLSAGLHAALRDSAEIPSLPYEAANTLLHTLRKTKEESMQRIYAILTVAFGVPCSLTAHFTYEYKDKGGNAHSHSAIVL